MRLSKNTQKVLSAFENVRWKHIGLNEKKYFSKQYFEHGPEARYFKMFVQCWVISGLNSFTTAFILGLKERELE